MFVLAQQRTEDCFCFQVTDSKGNSLECCLASLLSSSLFFLYISGSPRSSPWSKHDASSQSSTLTGFGRKIKCTEQSEVWPLVEGDIENSVLVSSCIYYCVKRTHHINCDGSCVSSSSHCTKAAGPWDPLICSVGIVHTRETSCGIQRMSHCGLFYQLIKGYHEMHSLNRNQ